MEIGSGIVMGRLHLPVGYRFVPTDEELVAFYLKRKFLDLPLPIFLFPEVDVFMSDPWSLPDDLKEKKKYFFSKKTSGDKGKIAAGSGYWKPRGKSKIIKASGLNQIVGLRRTLCFYRVEKPRSRGTKTQWIMHEFCLVDSSTNQITKNNEGEDWVIYTVTKRRRKPRNHGVIENYNSEKVDPEVNNSNCIDLMVQYSSDFGPPQPSSPNSSGGISEVFTNGVVDQEESGGFTILGK